MASVYIGLGSNIEREKHILTCMQQLHQDFPGIRFSKIYETPAEGFQGAPFLNLAAGFETGLVPEEINGYLKNLEDRHGRVRGAEKFSPRTLDADLLLYGQLNLQPEINLPHRDIMQYPFVLYPLAEIAADTIHPTYQRPIGQLATDSGLSRRRMTEVKLD